MNSQIEYNHDKGCSSVYEKSKKSPSEVTEESQKTSSKDSEPMYLS